MPKVYYVLPQAVEEKQKYIMSIKKAITKTNEWIAEQNVSEEELKSYQQKAIADKLYADRQKISWLFEQELSDDKIATKTGLSKKWVGMLRKGIDSGADETESGIIALDDINLDFARRLTECALLYREQGKEPFVTPKKQAYDRVKSLRGRTFTLFNKEVIQPKDYEEMMTLIDEQLAKRKEG